MSPIPVLLLICCGSWLTEGYVIGGGTQPGGGTYDPSTINNFNGIGGGVVPNGGNGGGVQRDEGGYCSSTSDCRAGLYCTASVNGVKICLSSGNGGGGNGYPTGNGGGCRTSANCRTGSVCVVSNGSGNCQIQTGGYVSPARQELFSDDKNAPEPGKLNSGCERDADCDEQLSCTLYFGELLCRYPIKPLIPLRCESDAECPSTEYLCVFSTAMQQRVCYKYGDVVTDGYVIPIKHQISIESKKTTTLSPRTPSRIGIAPAPETGLFAESEAVFPEETDGKLLSSTLQKRADKSQGPTPPIYMKMIDDVAEQHDGETKLVVKEQRTEQLAAPPEPIDPMATICEFDYHCRMGESCSAHIQFVDKNVTVCRYDILKKHRQCIYHSDCLSGQRCTSKSKDQQTATCESDINATLGSIPCFYDYECSGGEKCTLLSPGKFVCRPSPTSDPRSNQMCTTNAQCPFQQVCRHSGGISMCVDVSISRNPALLHERLWRFLRNFIFR